jgi:GntR family transcriptional repressor for pyruvate dehydrogenase complex
MKYKQINRPRPQSKTEQIVETVTEMILNGELRQNANLPPENEMCALLGVSRSIFRESMKILATKGLIEIKQGLGTKVSLQHENFPAEALSNYILLREISLLQVMEVRAPLEIEISKLAAKRRSKADIEAMEKTIRTMRDNRDDYHICIQVDHAFHDALVSAARNMIFTILMRSMKTFFMHLRKITIEFGIDKIIKQHSAIIEAISEKKPSAAASTMEAHMRYTLRDLKRLFAEKK